jgi:hypothetical protein
MRHLREIFAEVVCENRIVAPRGSIHDSAGRMVKELPSGVPARVEFELPATSGFFELRCEGEVIRQVLELAR